MLWRQPGTVFLPVRSTEKALHLNHDTTVTPGMRDAQQHVCGQHLELTCHGLACLVGTSINERPGASYWGRQNTTPYICPHPNPHGQRDLVRSEDGEVAMDYPGKA